MPSVNKVTMIGNLTRDPVTKQVGSSTVTEFGIALNRRFKTANGEDREEVTFVDVTAWAKAGEVIQKYCRKGKLLYVEGRLKLDTWEDKDGGKRSKLTVTLEEFQFLGGREDAGAGGGGGDQGDYTPAKPSVGNFNNAKPPARPAKPAPQDAVSDDVIFNPEDIPF